MGAAGLEPANSEEEGFTVPCKCRYATIIKPNFAESGSTEKSLADSLIPRYPKLVQH